MRSACNSGEPAGTQHHSSRSKSHGLALIEQASTIDNEIHNGRLAARRRHIERVARTIARWQGEGTADAGLDAGTTAGALVSMSSNFAYWWLTGGEDYYDDDIAFHTLTEIWTQALSLEKRAAIVPLDVGDSAT